MIQPNSLNNFLGVTLTNIAEGLAAQVNGDLEQDFTASSDGDTITIVGPAFEADLVTPFEYATVVLTGTPLEGESWNLTINGTPFVYTVQQGDVLNDVADALAALANQGTDLTVTAAAANIDISDINGTQLFTVSFTDGESFTLV